jgi:hypothetical protein
MSDEPDVMSVAFHVSPTADGSTVEHLGAQDWFVASGSVLGTSDDPKDG